MTLNTDKDAENNNSGISTDVDAVAEILSDEGMIMAIIPGSVTLEELEAILPKKRKQE